MDFLTQPVHSPAPPPTTFEGPSTSTQGPAPAAPSGTSQSTDTTSLAASEASTSDGAVEQTAARFAQLRTADTDPAHDLGLPGEAVIEAPSSTKGDWRAFGKVKAQIVLWPEKTVGHKSAKKLREADEGVEWVVEGVLWVTKAKEIVFVIDHNFPPLKVDRTKHKVSRRLSGSLSRPTSRGEASESANMSAPAGSALDTTEDENAGNTGKSPVLGFVKKVISAVTPGKSSSSSGPSMAHEGAGEGLALTRTRTGERGNRLTPTASRNSQRRASEGGAGGRLQFEEPVKEAPAPFPTYKGHRVNALYIANPSLVHAMRTYPYRHADQPTPKDLPVSGDPTDEKHQDPGNKIFWIHPPVIELDVVDKKYVNDEVEVHEGKKREVTVGFVFKEMLLVTEADSFRKRIEALMQGRSPSRTRSPSPTPAEKSSFGASLIRTISGKSNPAPAAPPVPGASDPVAGGVDPDTGSAGESETAPPVRRRRGSSFLRGMPQGDVWT
ncbi:hypothetical protein Rhopal_005866-T1 [Rhodotorula paludigena]|uniref:Uncharacterized protein n=1 Tax=Rhodotorula paludigena TaxID=86838 RepID=A0AAV5GW63_9BASI|nr:hypothetical protein Rhopal_005866-T1 [Rhodotorula paludigena]